MNKITKIGGVLIVFVALAALIGSTMTFAQTDEPDVPDVPTDVPADEAEVVPDVGGFNGRHGARGHQLFDKEMMNEALAAELGITVEELEAAREAAKGSVLAQLVADGTITQAQADAILSGEGLRSVGPILDQDEMKAVVADVLGMTVEELEAVQEDGTTLPELLEQQGVTVEELQAALQAAYEEAVAAALAEGTITQEQADQLIERGLQRGGRGGGPRGGGSGPRGGFGQGQGGFQGVPQNVPSGDLQG